MIITHLVGGLGNQMFQYSIGRYLAYKNNTELILDISEIKHSTTRPYELNHLNIKENFASNAIVNQIKMKKRNIITKLKIITHLTPNYNLNRYIEKKRYFFDNNVLNLTGNVYLHGYWQTDKYFNKISDIIKEEFTFKEKPDQPNTEMLSQIRSSSSIAVHIRRGDYVSNPKFNNFHGTTNIDYYLKASEYIKSKIDNPHFFIFSDDINWVNENLHLDSTTSYISHNFPDRNYEDLRLMAACKHFIIANSSFSWWGAWLSSESNKIIIAPKVWTKASVDTKDLYPPSWIKI